MSIESVIFAVLGLSFLIFIHELGHFLMARKAGMKVDVFSIGMGKPFAKWERKGVKYQLCWMPFGGYVRIAGEEGEEEKDLYKVKNGFYSKKPIYRILVAAAGPFVNFVFALIIFAGIHYFGGQQKPFSQYTSLIGSVDETSALYEEGVRPGDKVVSIDGAPYVGFKDILIQGMMRKSNAVSIAVEKQDGEIFSKEVKLYTPNSELVSPTLPKDWKSLGILSPASYVIAGEFNNKEYAPLANSGLEPGDRVVYADGNIIYSVNELSAIVNKDIALVTVDRDGKKLHLQIPRVLLGDLKLSEEQRDEFVDYKRDMDLEGAIASTYFIPYLVSEGLYVRDTLTYIEEEGDQMDEKGLLPGDKILAVAGERVESTKNFYELIAKRRCLIMVSSAKEQEVLWTNADKEFLKALNVSKIRAMENHLGERDIHAQGQYRFLPSSTPVSYKEYLEKASPALLEKTKEAMSTEAFNKAVNKQTLFSGVALKEEKVIYNPGPFTLAKDVMADMAFSLKALFTGQISPKHMSGPVGMVKIVHDGTKSSLVTGIYWLGMISLNLGLMNLLPLPILDGGRICLTFYEMVTRKKISAKTMQKLIVPSVALILFFFAYVTFYDVIKVFS